MQIPIGVESDLKGIVDLVERKAYQFSGHKGTTVEEIPVPVGLTEEVRNRPRVQWAHAWAGRVETGS